MTMNKWKQGIPWRSFAWSWGGKSRQGREVLSRSERQELDALRREVSDLRLEKRALLLASVSATSGYAGRCGKK